MLASADASQMATAEVQKSRQVSGSSCPSAAHALAAEFAWLACSLAHAYNRGSYSISARAGLLCQPARLLCLGCFDASVSLCRTAQLRFTFTLLLRSARAVFVLPARLFCTHFVETSAFLCATTLLYFTLALLVCSPHALFLLPACLLCLRCF